MRCNGFWEINSTVEQLSGNRKRTSGGPNSIIVCHDKVMTFTLPLYGLLTRPNNKRHML